MTGDPPQLEPLPTRLFFGAAGLFLGFLFWGAAVLILLFLVMMLEIAFALSPEWRLFLAAPAILIPTIGLPALYVYQRKQLRLLEQRSIVTSSGFTLVPASGTIEDPIIVMETNPASIPGAEHAFIAERLFPGKTIRPLRQSLIRAQNGGMIDCLEVEIEGETREIYFDVSRSALFR